MSIQNRGEATSKNIEGQAQESLGNASNDPQAQTEGHAKQVEAETIHAAEDLKVELQDKEEEVKEKFN